MLKPFEEIWSIRWRRRSSSYSLFLHNIGEVEIDAVADAIRSGWLTTGPRVAAFELEFAEHVGGGVDAIAVNPNGPL